MTTTHQYLEKYPISPESEKLIVGTIHPHDHEKFEIPFFYGNMSTIWKILNEAFPNELGKPLSLEGITEFLKKRKMSVSDTIQECQRKASSAKDSDLTDIKLNHEILEQIRKSKINEILFTSGFGKNNAFRLFYVDILKQKLTDEIKSNRGIVLGSEHFGRPVKLTVLHSPSGAANIGLSKSKAYLENKHKYKDSKKPVQAFKIDYYREKFS